MDLFLARPHFCVGPRSFSPPPFPCLLPFVAPPYSFLSPPLPLYGPPGVAPDLFRGLPAASLIGRPHTYPLVLGRAACLTGASHALRLSRHSKCCKHGDARGHRAVTYEAPCWALPAGVATVRLLFGKTPAPVVHDGPVQVPAAPMPCLQGLSGSAQRLCGGAVARLCLQLERCSWCSLRQPAAIFVLFNVCTGAGADFGSAQSGCGFQDLISASRDRRAGI